MTENNKYKQIIEFNPITAIEYSSCYNQFFMSLRKRYSVKSIDNSNVKEWLIKKHYAKRIPVILHSFGLFDKENILIGVCCFGNAPSSFWNNGGTLFNNKHNIKTYELNRLVLNNNHEKNLTSFFVSNCIKMLEKECVIISYADMNYKHCGYIYQATNFIYTGIAESGYKQEWEFNGKKRHGRWMSDIKKILGEKYNPGISFHKNIINNGGKIPEQKNKYRYVFIKSKKRNQLIKDMIYKEEKYPKEENENYENEINISVQGFLF